VLPRVRAGDYCRDILAWVAGRPNHFLLAGDEYLLCHLQAIEKPSIVHGLLLFRSLSFYRINAFHRKDDARDVMSWMEDAI
jgi:hypothetical protein